jgi:hypothetical protein
MVGNDHQGKVVCAVRFFRQKIALENAIGSHACSLEASRRATNGTPLGCPLFLPVSTAKWRPNTEGTFVYVPLPPIDRLLLTHGTRKDSFVTADPAPAAMVGVPGVVFITVHTGVDLPEADRDGLADPYVKVHLLQYLAAGPHETKLYKTHVENSTLQPEWDNDVTVLDHPDEPWCGALPLSSSQATLATQRCDCVGPPG